MTILPNVLRQGDHGAAVRELQLLLNRRGAAVTVDGWFGAGTETAVKAAQQAFGLVIDGIAGPKTLQTLASGVRHPCLLTQAALDLAAQTLRVPLATIRAVNEVESRGLGFLPDGRPVILYERHIMYRELKTAKHDADALTLQFPNLVNPKRGGYVGGAGEHTRLARASHIEHAYALSSASWGLFQIMGFHWQRLGYASAEVFADAMRVCEANQLDAFVRFIATDDAMHRALKARKWSAFASLYNGLDYKANLYDTKLSRAYDKYADEVSA